MARASLTRDEVLDTAGELVKRHGPRALTMRKLAAELGTAVTSIYWHVGNRESLLDELVRRTVADLGEIRPAGRTPVERIVSVARILRRRLRDRPHLIALVHERGLTDLMFLPARRALVREVHAAGLRGARAAEAVRAVQFQVVGFVLVERNRERAPAQRPVPHPYDDPELARALARPVNEERLFVTSVRALTESLLNGPGPREPTGPGEPKGPGERAGG